MPDMPDLNIYWDLLGYMLKSTSREINGWMQLRTPAELWADAWADAMLAGLR